MKPADYDIGIKTLRCREIEVKEHILRCSPTSLSALKHWKDEAKALRACAAKLLLLKKEASLLATSQTGKKKG